MTSPSADDPNDEIRAALQAAFDTPRDVVAGPGMTRESVLQANDMADQQVTLTEPGAPIYSSDGDLIGMAEPTTSTATFAGLTITRAEADRLGLNEKEVPNVNIV